MDALLGTLRARREDLIERGAHLAESTRDRGLGALGKVRSNALDWRKTLAARRAELADDAPWYALAGLERRVLTRVERALALFSARVRAEMDRLRRLELARGTDAQEDAPAPKKKGKARAAKNAGAAPKRFVLPIADYETMSVREVLAELPRLSDAQCRAILEFERAHKNRRTLLKALEPRALAH